MKKLLFMICLPVFIFASCLNVFAAKKQAPEDAKIQMIGEITRGSDEVFNCTVGMTSDREMADCLDRVLDENIQKDKDSAEFLLGAYFTGFARLTAGNPTEKVKDKWLATCFSRFSEIQKHLGFTDKELAEITRNTAVLPELAKMRMKVKSSN
jgi:hypothetical protein